VVDAAKPGLLVSPQEEGRESVGAILIKDSDIAVGVSEPYEILTEYS
jgi:hypothetical protein